MIKFKTTADTYKSVVLRRAILICWALLFVCFAVKIFGGNYFAIMVNSPRFVQFCQFLDNNIVLYGLIGMISSLISYFFYYLAILQKFKFSKSEFMIYLTSVIIFCIIRTALMNFEYRNLASLFINAIQYFVIPYILLGKEKTSRKFLKSLFAFSLNFIFQLIALITKNIGVKFTTDSSLVTIIFMIDIYIMLILYYLYSNNYVKKGDHS